MNRIRKLTIPDFVSLTGLFFAWVSILLVLKGEIIFAIRVNLLAFLFDLLDGFLARRLRQETTIGRQLDSFVDVVTYLFFSVVLFSKYAVLEVLPSVLVGVFVLSFGILRLIRFNNEGLLEDGHGSYFRGVSVVHISLVVLACFFLSRYFSFWTTNLSTIIILFSCPLMLSNLRCYKPKSLWFYAFLLAIIFLITVNLENGHFK